MHGKRPGSDHGSSRTCSNNHSRCDYRIMQHDTGADHQCDGFEPVHLRVESCHGIKQYDSIESYADLSATGHDGIHYHGMG